MSDKKRKVPKLRFPGFTDAWEQRKLESVLLVSTEKNIRNEYSRNEVLSVSREAGTVNQIEYQGRSFAGEDLSGYKVVHEGELIYTKSPLRGAPYGIFQVATIRGILSPLYAVYKSSNLALASFVATYLKNDSVATKYLAPLVTKGAKNTINVTDEGALKGKILIPQVAEQQRIYSLFVKIDGLLSLHQRKLDNVKMLKKSLLQKLFPKDGEKIPELRFPGFTDAWEQRKLDEISKRVTRKNSNLESTLPLTISAQYGLVDQITFFNKQIASKDMSGYYLIKKGEFAYNKSYSKDAPWGAVKRLDNYDKGVLSSLYIVFKLSSNIDSDFVAKYFETSNWHSEVSKRATEGARDHGLLNISASDFLSIEILIPNKTMEQKEIAQFLKLVDSTLSLHQRKLDHLKELKKGLLQQMFV